MKIFINMATLKVGGGKFVAFNFLESLLTIQAENASFKIIAVVPNDNHFVQFSSPNCKIILVPQKYNHSISRFFLLDRWLIKQAKTCDVIFSMGNIAIPQTKLPQVLLFHVPHPVYPESIIWKRMDLKGWIYAKLYVYFFNIRIKYANHIIVQTETMKNRLIKNYGIASEKISLCSNAYKVHVIKNKKIVLDSKIKKIEGIYHLFCLTHYYPHKNLEVLVEVAQLIKAKMLPFKIVITISPNQHPAARKLLNSISKQNLKDIILNIGPIVSSEIEDCYNSSDALLLPTLLESFSGTYLEAMMYEKPIFTSDMDFAREICGDAAYYFNPLNAKDILSVIENTFNAPDEIKTLVSKGKERIKSQSEWDVVGKKMFDILVKTKFSMKKCVV